MCDLTSCIKTEPALMWRASRRLVTGSTMMAVLCLSAMASAGPVFAQFELAGTSWAVVERSYERVDSAWVNRDPEPGLYVFTDHHYSVQEIRESGPRPNFGASTTDEERLRAFEVFHAHGGTYDVEGDQIFMTITIAKGPNTMNGVVSAYDLRWRGELLEMIRTSEAENETRVTTLRQLPE